VDNGVTVATILCNLVAYITSCSQIPFEHLTSILCRRWKRSYLLRINHCCDTLRRVGDVEREEL
jgi:hypothetical protein